MTNKKCGEVTFCTQVGKRVYILNCLYCSQICLQWDMFIHHIEQEHDKDLGFEPIVQAAMMEKEIKKEPGIDTNEQYPATSRALKRKENSMDPDEVLIEEVRNRTILFDLGHSDYKNLKKKKNEWKKVAAVLKLNETDCKKRWKVLRDSYKRCKRMEQQASGSGTGIPKKKWKYFDSMSFLENYKSSRGTFGNNCSDLFEKAEEVINTDSTDLYSVIDTECSMPSPREKVKKESEKFQEFPDLAASTISSISSKCGAFSTSRKEDSTSAHFLTLAAKIREAEMPPNIVNQIECKVSNLVFSEIAKFHSTIQNN